MPIYAHIYIVYIYYMVHAYVSSLTLNNLLMRTSLDTAPISTNIMN